MIYAFGDFELDEQRTELRRSRESVHVRPKAFDLLLFLLKSEGRTVSKDQLLEALWPDQAVGDSVLTTCVRDARHVVGDSGTAQRVIQTVHGRGYRFVAEARVIDCAAGSGPVAGPSVEARATDGSPAPRSDSDDAWLAASAPPGVTGEHKTVSVLCCGLAFADDLTVALGAELNHAVRQRLESLARDVLAEYGGTLYRVLDHGLIALFGAPVAHEDHAYRAVAAASRLRSRVGELSAAVRGADDGTADLTVTLSQGVHSGRVLVGSGDGGQALTITAVGDALQMAESLCRVAGGGVILLSQAVNAALSGRARVEPVELEAGKAAGAMELLALSAPPVRRSVLALEDAHGLTPFVGRTLDAAVLDALWQQAIQGRGQVVGLVGEAGVGKSRLLLELCQRRATEGAVVLAAQCLSYAQATPYFPLIQLLRSACGIDPTEGAVSADEKLCSLTARLGLDWSEESRHVLLGVLQLGHEASWTDQHAALGPAQLRTRAFGLLRELIVASSRDQPVLLAVEDVHWIDATSNEWLEDLVRHLGRATLLLVATFRPGYRPPWTDASYATQHVVQPLGPAQSTELLTHVLAGHELPDDAAEAILQRAEGNPLFLEELAHAAVEHPVQSCAQDVPSSVQAVLAARIDRLPPMAKHVLQVAAVIGREAPLRLVEQVADVSGSSLVKALKALRTAELLSEVQGDAERTLVFKHALTQDAAHDGLMAQDRKKLHGLIARALCDEFVETVQLHPAKVARHFTEAGLFELAIEWWLRAGRGSTERSANEEAIEQIRQGLALLHRLPTGQARDAQELQLHASLAAPLLMLRGHAVPEVTQALERVRDLSVRTGNPVEMYIDFAVTLVAGKLEQAREIADRTISLGEEGGHSAAVVQGHMYLTFSLLHLGHYEQAAEAAERGIALYDPEQHHYIAMVDTLGYDAGVSTLIYGAHLMWLLGFPCRAEARAHQAMALAQRLNHNFSRAMVLYMTSWNQTMFRDVELAAKLAEDAITECTAHGFQFYLAGAKITGGWARAKGGDVAAGLAQMNEGLAGWRATGAQVGVPYFWALIAEIQLEAGDNEAAERALTQGLSVAAKTGEGFFVSELHRLRGELMLALPEPDEGRAEDHLDESRRIARDQHALSLELRSAMGLGRLWQRQGKGSAAKNMVSRLYDRFTEGFDTPDLVEAKHLIDSLK